MLKRQRTLTPPPADVPHGFDYGFGFGVGSSTGADDDYIDATGFGHIAKRRRVTIPLPSRSHNPSQSYPNGSTDEDDCDDEGSSSHGTPSSAPPTESNSSEYRNVNDLLHRLHLEHTKRSYLQALSVNGKQPSHTTDDWDTQLFDVAKFHAHNTVKIPAPTQGFRHSTEVGRDHVTKDQRRETHEETSSVSEQYQERNRLLGNAVRMRMRGGQNDASRPS